VAAAADTKTQIDMLPAVVVLVATELLYQAQLLVQTLLLNQHGRLE